MLRPLLVLSCVALLGACTSSSSIGTSTTGAAASSTTTAPVDTTPTTAPTTDAPTTTTEAPASPLTLRVDGLGTFDFGSPAPDVLDALTAALGAADTDEPRIYTVPDGAGGYTTADGEMGFAQSVGRSVCWLFGFCAEFGGGFDASDAQLQFMGWSYGGDAAGTLSTADGITLGTRWSDAPTITAQPGGCYTVGYGQTAEGIHVSLLSDGVPFVEFDGTNYLEHVPDPADVTVSVMRSGDIPEFLFADC